MSQSGPSPEQRAAHGALRIAIVALGVVAALSSFYVAPNLTSHNVAAVPGSDTGAGGGSGGAGGAGSSGSAAGGGAAAAGSGASGGQQGGGAAAAAAGSKSGLSCPGNNGGNTDVGVDKRSIHLAATEVLTGIGSSFLGPVRYGMFAVVQKTNRSGGICGRQLSLQLKDDGWDAQTGKQYLDNFIQSNQYLALAVVPSSEGLNAASLGGDIDRAPDSAGGGNGIPVIGSDGMLNSQYTDPWIWPVAASTSTSMRIMARDAHKRSAKTFAIVYDASYKFGVEGAGAFVAQVKRDGGSIAQACEEALTAGQSDYSTQVSQFNKACGNDSSKPVDFVALLLEPQTAEAWLQSNPYMGVRKDGSGVGAGGPQPLFDLDFANKCGATCQGLQIWTSFFPPIYPFDQHAAVQQYRQDLCAVDGNCPIDMDSAFTEGGYVGMTLVVQALQQASPNLTRAGLRQALDSMTLKGTLSSDLTYKAGNHYANLTMIAFRDQYSSNAQFEPVDNGAQQTDPCAGCKDPQIGS